MGMTDVQFKAYLRLAIRRLEEALQADTPEKKDEIIKALAEDYKKTLED